jgi:RNA-directed DNA polymerase
VPFRFGWCARESDRASPFNLAAVYQAWRGCRRRKRGSRSAQRYEVRLLDNLVETRDALEARRWVPGRPVCFVTLRPKAREVHAAPFADRVVHHLLVPRLEALFEPGFIHDSWSNRRGKGIHAAVDRLQAFMRQASRNGQRRAWFLQLDIRNFFVSLDRGILLDLIGRRLGRQVRRGKVPRDEAAELYRLCRTLLQAPDAGTALRLGPPWTFTRVPPHKRLAEAPPGKGLPIGNLTSQFFANVYLDRLDQFVKHDLKARRYLRYVDDFVLVADDADTLVRWRERIRAFLADELALALKDDGVLKPVSRGADFLGYIVRPGYKLVRRRVVVQARRRLRGQRRRLLRPDGPGVGLHLDRDGREALRAGLASYLGHFRHACGRKLVQRLWAEEPWLGRLLRPGRNGRLFQVWEPAEAVYFRDQVEWFRRQWPGFAVLIQRGRAFDAIPAGREPLPLPPPPRGRRRKSAAGKGRSEPAAERKAPGRDLPLRRLAGLRLRLRTAGVPHIFVAEEGVGAPRRLKRRVLRLAWAPRRPRAESGRAS